LAKEIVKGKTIADECVSLDPPISIQVNGSGLALNTFTAQLFKTTVLAMVSALKGVRKGPVEIKIP
jgi:hypothetical protein